MCNNKVISITGWSKGIGKEVCSKLSDKYSIHKVKNRLENIDGIIEEIKDTEIFINNASFKFKQVELFIELFKEWKLENKLIINIGSRAGEPNLCKNIEYGSSKSALWMAHSNALYNTNKICKLTYLSLGLINSEIESLSFDDVIETIDYVLKAKEHIEISAIHVQHREAYSIVQSKKANYIKEEKKYRN